MMDLHFAYPSSDQRMKIMKNIVTFVYFPLKTIISFRKLFKRSAIAPLLVKNGKKFKCSTIGNGYIHYGILTYYIAINITNVWSVSIHVLSQYKKAYMKKCYLNHNVKFMCTSIINM